MESLGVQLSSKALKAIIAEVVLEIFTTMYEMWFFREIRANLGNFSFKFACLNVKFDNYCMKFAYFNLKFDCFNSKIGLCFNTESQILCISL